MQDKKEIIKRKSIEEEEKENKEKEEKEFNEYGYDKDIFQILSTSIAIADLGSDSTQKPIDKLLVLVRKAK